MANKSASSQIPAIESFQFEHENIGKLQKSVNLFRGDLNYQLKLLQLPCRPGRHELAVKVTLLYQSNVQHQVDKINGEAPTGMLGLGWSMESEKIIAKYTGSPSALTMKYYLQQGESLNALTLVEIDSDGTHYYQSEQFRFWRIAYDPQKSQWIITKEDGVQYCYGGITQSEQGNAKTLGNSIEWAVKWGGGAGNWSGDSSLDSSDAAQTQFPVAWHLAQVTDTYGDSIYYEYQVTEQAVGSSSGAVYTKAIYPSKITDVFGRTVNFNYQAKTYNTVSDPTKPREYTDPHKTDANDDPNAYQDRYETLYLDNIEIHASSGELISQFIFSYTLQNYCFEATAGVLYGNTFKRYLTGVTQFNNEGLSQPGLLFDYYQTTSDGPNLGAMKSITYPEGGVAVYTYEKNELSICQRQVTITPPDSINTPANACSPRVWFGKDYVLTLWYNNTSGKFAIALYTWIGHWQAWSGNGKILNSDGVTFSLDKVSVVTQEDSLSICLSDGTDSYLYLCHKNSRSLGDWHTILTKKFTTPTVQLYSGDDFVLAYQTTYNSQSGQNEYQVTPFTWHWNTPPNQAWQSESWYEGETETLSHPTFYAAHGNYYLAATIDSANSTCALNLNYLDNLGAWHASDSKTITFTTPPITNPESSAPFYALTASESFVVATFVTQTVEGSYTNYTLQIYQWDDDYKFLTTDIPAYNFEQENNGASWPFLPQIVNNSLICSGGNLLRYNGNTWLENQALKIANANSAFNYWFAYGNDLALRTINRGSTYSAEFIVFDPDTNSQSWSQATGTALEGTPPATQPISQSYYPTMSGNDEFTMGNAVYFRGHSTNWQSSLAHPFDITQIINTTSVINQAPNFLTYYLAQGEESTYGTQILIIKNGQIQTPLNPVLQHQKYYTDGEGSGDSDGQKPYGDDSFITYDGTTYSSFNVAQSFNLYRFAANNITGDLIHYPVVGLDISDGYDQHFYTTYVYDDSSATCDPTGLVVKYYQSTVIEGTNSSNSTPYGKTEHYFINGIDPNNALTATQQTVSNMLDGKPLKQLVYDTAGTLVASTQNTWQVYTSRNISPTSKDASPTLLHGGFVCKTATSTMRDGVTLNEQYDYVPDGFDYPFSGLLISTTSTCYNAQGVKETLVKKNKYGYEVYTELYNAHQLTPQIQTQQWLNDKPYTSQASVWKSWTVDDNTFFAPYQGFKWLGGSTSPDFPFAGEATNTSGWLLDNQVQAYTNKGLVSECIDAMSIPKSSIFDKNQQYLLAAFNNASLTNQECFYSSFESYEDTSAWKLTSAQTAGGNTLTGLQSLVINSKGSAVRTLTTSPRASDVQFVCWYKTPSDFTADATTGCTVSFSQQGKPLGKPAFFAFAATKGQWSSLSAVVTIPTSATVDANTPITITFALANTSDQTIAIDHCRLSPKTCLFHANVYDPTYGVETDKIDESGQIKRTIYNAFQHHVGMSDRNDVLHHLALPYFSKAGNASGFNPADPNALIKLSTQSSGYLERFSNGDTWQTRWQASNANSNWQTKNQTLYHTASAADSLSYQLALATNFAFYTEFKPGISASTLSFTDAMSVTLGDDVVLTYNDENNNWSLTLSEKGVTNINQATSAPSTLLLIVQEDMLIFYVNQQMIFSTKATSALTGKMTLNVGKNEVGLHHVCISNDPIVGVLYHDALGHTRQSHQLVKQDSMIRQIIYDDRAHPCVHTKAAPGSYGQGAKVPCLAYHDDFVNVADFIKNLNVTGVMQGDVADYYSENTVGRSNDEGYPYTRALKEFSPLARVIEKGEPGKALGIVNYQSSQPKDRNTLQYQYSSNTLTSLPGGTKLPANSYFQVTEINPVKETYIKIHDLRKRMILKQSAAQETPETPELISTIVASYSSNGHTISTYQPNYYSDNTSASDYCETQQYNSIGNLISHTHPDTKTTKYMYDSNGKLRFAQDQEGAKNNYLIYIKYDDTGREIESGQCQFEWTPSTTETLQTYADNPTLPAENSPLDKFTPVISRQYGSDGTQVDDLGKLTNMTTITGATGNVKTTVTETFAYTELGKLASHSLTIGAALSPQNGKQYTTSYQYDIQGNVKLITYPQASGSPIDTVYYTYDYQGRLSEIGSDADHPDSYASYTFNADGQICQEILNPAAPISGTLQYNSPELPADVSYTASGQSQVCYQSTTDYYANSTLKTIADTVGSLKAPSNTATCDYDALAQLHSTKNTAEESWNFQSSYDANGNFQSPEWGGESAAYAYVSGTNQLQQVTYADKSTYALNYYENGFVQSTKSSLANQPQLDFIYEATLGVTASITNSVDATTMAFGYNYAKQRVLKQVMKQSKLIGETLYLRNINHQSLLEIDQTGAVTAYVHSPLGLVAMNKNNEWYYIVKDSEGSTRVVMDASGKIAASYRYLPYGQLAGVYESTPNFINYLYTGQEFDRELDLYNYRARFYDYKVGYFLAPDPKLQFNSLYLYCNDDPLSFVDPTGEKVTEFEAYLCASLLIGIGGITVIASGGTDVPLLMALWGTVGSSLLGGGTAIMSYLAFHKFNADVVGKMMLMGFAGGAVGGLISSTVSALGVAVFGEAAEDAAATSAVSRFMTRITVTRTVQLTGWKFIAYQFTFKVIGFGAAFAVSQRTQIDAIESMGEQHDLKERTSVSGAILLASAAGSLWGSKRMLFEGLRNLCRRGCCCCVRRAAATTAPAAVQMTRRMAWTAADDA